MTTVTRRSLLAALTGGAALALSGCGQSRAECEAETRQRWRTMYQRQPTPAELDQQCRRRSSRSGTRGGGVAAGK